MARRRPKSIWPASLTRAMGTVARRSLAAGAKAATQAVKRAIKESLKRQKVSVRASRAPASRRPVATDAKRAGRWLHGLAVGAGGPRSYHLYQPPAAAAGVRLPLVVMLHGCNQDAAGFASSTRMNALAARESFYVLYPEQDRLAHPHGCWNWFETRSGRAYAEVESVMAAIDQVCNVHGADPARVAIAGLSAGASLAALAAYRHPERFKALIMHSGLAPGSAHSTLTALSAMRGRRPAPQTLLGPRPTARAATAIDAARRALDGSASTPHHWPASLVIQGDADAVVNPSNGRSAAEFWAELTRAKAVTSRRVQRGQRHASVLTDFKQGTRKTVTLCAIEGLGHGWSGGDIRLPFGDNHGPDASRMLWAFARKQFEAGDTP